MNTLRLGWFTSAWDEQAVTLFQTVLKAIESSQIDAVIDFLLLTQKPEDRLFAKQLENIARKRQIPVVSLNTISFKMSTPPTNAEICGQETWREKYENSVVSALEGFSPDLVVLSGYMWIAGEILLRKYRMLNLHPALPSGDVGMRSEVIRSIIARRDSVAGAMMHVVNESLDQGQPLTYCRIPLAGSGWDSMWSKGGIELEKAIEQAIVSHEPHLMVETLKILAQVNVDHWPPIGSEWPIEIHLSSLD